MSALDLPPMVTVEILLQGGHRQKLRLRRDDPLLANLFNAVYSQAQPNGQYQALFQINIGNGEAVLCFSSNQLVGITTSPPLWVQPPASPKPIAAAELNHSSSAPEPPKPLYPCHHVVVNHLLSEAELAALWQFVAAHGQDFSPASVSTDAVDYRRAQVLHHFPQFRSLLVKRVQALLPEVLKRLKIPPFPLGEIEAQLTVHHNGHYYKMHNDNGSPDTASRVLTYVYYFYQDPKPFEGGELVLYDSEVVNHQFQAAASRKVIEPKSNALIFFASHHMHEVLPVRCDSQEFLAGRFTINGWVRRAGLAATP